MSCELAPKVFWQSCQRMIHSQRKDAAFDKFHLIPGPKPLPTVLPGSRRPEFGSEPLGWVPDCWWVINATTWRPPPDVVSSCGWDWCWSWPGVLVFVSMICGCTEFTVPTDCCWDRKCTMAAWGAAFWRPNVVKAGLEADVERCVGPTTCCAPTGTIFVLVAETNMPVPEALLVKLGILVAPREEVAL